MKTVYTPVFYTNSQPTASTSRDHTPSAYLDNLSRKHIALAQIVQEVPVETEEDPESTARIEVLRKKVVKAFQHANGDPADGKWAFLVKLLRTGATAGRSRWLGTTREGEKAVSSIGWINAQTESEWLEWENNWVEEDRLKSKVEDWKKLVEVHQPSNSIISILEMEESEVEDPLQKGEGVAVPPINEPVRPPVRPAATSLNLVGRDPRDPSALGFTVKKRSSLAVTEKPRPSEKQKLGTEFASPSELRSSVIQGVDPVLHGDEQAKGIEDVSETSFLPPSFPSQLRTSTPNAMSGRRQKPPPIAPALPSSPFISPPIIRTYGRPRGLEVSSSFPELPSTPTHKPIFPAAREKRPRSVTPERPSKKARKLLPLPSSGDIIPLEATSVAENDLRSSPMAIAPKQLPTLMQLLASSKKSKTSPRKDHRLAERPTPKLNSKGKHKATGMEKECKEVSERNEVSVSEKLQRHRPFEKLQTLEKPHISGLGVNLGYSITSPTKSLSSLAQSDSDSDDGGVDTNFMPDLDDEFDPPFVSTQVSNVIKGVGSGLHNGSSGFGWAGYSSQFDVNGKVDQVSRFMEKDVDYGGWLRDSTPELEDVGSQ